MAYKDVILAESGLIHYWQMGEASGHFADSIGSDPTTSEGSGILYYQPGPAPNSSDKAASFDGTTNAVAQTASSTYVLGNVLTIEAWVFPAVGSLSSRRTVYSHNEVASGLMFEIGNGSGNRSVSAAIPGTFIAVTTANVLSEGVWTHIVYTRSGTGAGTHAIYLNGILQGLSTNSATNFADGAAAKQIGRRTSATPQNFLGTIKDLAIYNIALSQTRVQVHYLAAPYLGKPGNIRPNFSAGNGISVSGGAS